MSSSGPDPADRTARDREQDAAFPSWGNLGLRLITAAVLGPLVLAIVYFGAPYTDIFFAASAGVMAWEWARLCGQGELERPGVVIIMAVTASLAAAAVRQYDVAGWIAAFGAMAAAVLGARSGGKAPSHWYALGVIYLSLACIALIWLREFPEIGRDILFWLLLVIWATDTGAYAAGRLIGGPKLAPKISPKKTWAGLVGGVGAGLAMSMAAGRFFGFEGLATLAAMGVVLALVSQGGDLFESAVKRRFGAKDSSNLVPGHGGMLDRADSVLAGALAVAAMLRVKGTLI